MKTIIFSTIFYLIGVKVGNFIDSFMSSIFPSKTQIIQSAPKAKKPEKAYYMQTDTVKEKKAVGKLRKNQNETGAPLPQAIPLDSKQEETAKK